GKKIIALAGIIETQETALTPQTKNILVGCASWVVNSQKKPVTHLDTSTQTQQHFDSRQVLQRTISLINELLGGKSETEITSAYHPAKKFPLRKSIAIGHQFLEKKISQAMAPVVIENA